jgi:hypothetical protein
VAREKFIAIALRSLVLGLVVLALAEMQAEEPGYTTRLLKVKREVWKDR